MRSHSERRVAARIDCVYPAIELSLLHNSTGKIGPAYKGRAGEVIDAPGLTASHSRCTSQQGIGNRIGWRRPAKLIVDYTDRITFCCQSQHSTHEVSLHAH